MTDNEIRDYLKEIAFKYDNSYARYTLDLISRLQTKIEELEKERNSWRDGYINQKQEIMNLELELENKSICIEEILSTYAEIKVEAYKEFAKELKEVDGYNNHTFDDCASILVPEEYRKGRDEKSGEIWTTIDRLLKEKIGENNV